MSSKKVAGNGHGVSGSSPGVRAAAPRGLPAGELDYVLVSLLVIFYGFGLVMVFSASLKEGIALKDPLYYFKRQVLWTLLSMAACAAFIFVDPRALGRARRSLVWAVVVMLVILLLPRAMTGGFVHPSRRWFRVLSLGFQPSEFAKFVLVVYFASILSRKGERIRDFYRGFLPPFLVMCVISLLVFLQPDFSTAFLIFYAGILIFFVAGARALSIASLAAVSVPALVLMIFGRGYRADRIFSYLNPWMDPTDKGYQIIQSFKAFAYGGLTGVGLGRSVQKMKYLPIPHSDFIYAIIAEETGFFGAMLVIILYLFLAYRGFSVAYGRQESYEFLLAFGFTSMIVWGAIFNMAVVTGLLPSTGITLPFISYGGSSLLANSMMIGVLLNLSRKRAFQASPAGLGAEDA
jgi:cell division protein FtsW